MSVLGKERFLRPLLTADLSTLHTLRDTTLSHTHSIMSHLLKAHTVPTSYRLLPRSATNNDAANGNAQWRNHLAWGCIRLAPSASSPVQPKHDLKPIVRRTSSAFQRRPSVRKSATLDSAARPVDHVPHFRLDLDQAIIDDDEDEEVSVELKTGYQSGTTSDDEAEEDSADVVVEREITKRGVKEG